MERIIYNALTVEKLKDSLRRKGLKVGGTKQKLIDRLIEFDIANTSEIASSSSIASVPVAKPFMGQKWRDFIHNAASKDLAKFHTRNIPKVVDVGSVVKIQQWWRSLRFVVLPIINEPFVAKLSADISSLPGECSKFFSCDLEGFQVLVKCLDGGTITCLMESTDTVEVLKAKVTSKTGIPPDLQRLICNSKTLENGFKLTHYDIQSQSTIYLTLRLHGDGKRAASDNTSKEERLLILETRYKKLSTGLSRGVASECEDLAAVVNIDSVLHDMQIGDLMKLFDEVTALSTYTLKPVAEIVSGHLSKTVADNDVKLKILTLENECINLAVQYMITSNFMRENGTSYNWTTLTAQIEDAKSYVKGLAKGRSMETQD